ncbi:hypothetical protein [Pseudonocardia oceani]|uniref:hypothetical protein n=1 Tax=Pseudonocardia oceani TaxID=2792013 RepID=UPI001CEC8968|nr:hypothetical protein [Pseudonocardia oceani]
MATLLIVVMFLTVMAFAGVGVDRLFRLDPVAGRAIVFTGATRNSLVVLPLALAPPDALAVAAVVTVTRSSWRSSAWPSESAWVPRPANRCSRRNRGTNSGD